MTSCAARLCPMRGYCTRWAPTSFALSGDRCPRPATSSLSLERAVFLVLVGGPTLFFIYGNFSLGQEAPLLEGRQRVGRGRALFIFWEVTNQFFRGEGPPGRPGDRISFLSLSDDRLGSAKLQPLSTGGPWQPWPVSGDWPKPLRALPDNACRSLSRRDRPCARPALLI